MRRSSLALLLSFLLVLVQQGAVLHELGHLSHHEPGAVAATSVDPHGLNGAYCPACEGFAQIANPAAGAVPVVPVRPAGALPLPVPYYSIVAANAPTPRSRGPPHS